jgi:hypothetical protein
MDFNSSIKYHSNITKCHFLNAFLTKKTCIGFYLLIQLKFKNHEISLLESMFIDQEKGLCAPFHFLKRIKSRNHEGLVFKNVFDKKVICRIFTSQTNKHHKDHEVSLFEISFWQENRVMDRFSTSQMN